MIASTSPASEPGSTRSAHSAVFPDRTVSVDIDGSSYELGHGAVAIAAVTSCTTATDPAMMIACGLIARNAERMGLAPKPWVKTILAPGSHATELLLKRAGLLEPLGSSASPRAASAA